MLINNNINHHFYIQCNVKTEFIKYKTYTTKYLINNL